MSVCAGQVRRGQGEKRGVPLESRQEMRPREHSRDWDVEEEGPSAARAQEGEWP